MESLYQRIRFSLIGFVAETPPTTLTAAFFLATLAAELVTAAVGVAATVATDCQSDHRSAEHQDLSEESDR